MKAKVKHQADHERQELHEIIPLKTPLVLYIEPSGFCNLKCNFCPQQNSKMKKDNMSWNVFKKLIDDIEKFKKKLKLLRICGNGEPLINENIIEFCQYAYNKKIAEKIELVTNGILLKDYHIKYLPQYLTRIIVSIEGLSSEEYEAMSGKLINYNKLLTDLENLYKNRNKCIISIKTVNEVTKISEKKDLFFRLFGDISNEIYIENLIPMWPELFSNYKIKSRWEDEEVPKRQVCVQIFKGMQIQANGDVVPCCVDWQRINNLGNINNTSIINIWRSDKMKNLQLNHLKGFKDKLIPCKDCVMNDTCDPDNIDDYRIDLFRRLL